MERVVEREAAKIQCNQGYRRDVETAGPALDYPLTAPDGGAEPTEEAR